MKRQLTSLTRRWHMSGLPIAIFALFSIALSPSHAHTGQSTTTTHVPAVFSGGHDTDPRDRGRPVVLVAGALGMPPDLFREAFTHVHPAPAGSRPTPDEARANKAALLAALGPYGITNDRLDTVSNYYRYVRSRGEMWPTRPARAYALVQNGAVTSYVVTDGGSGYSSPPAVTVPSVPAATATVTLSFSSDFDKNGAVAAIVKAPVPR